MKKILFFAFLSCILFISCGKDNSVNPPSVETKFKGVFIVNEGLYGQNNSTVSFYNPETELVTNNVYEAANPGINLGDNANDIEVFGDKGYIAVDNSNKIEIINISTFKSLGSIDLGTNGSPRDIVIIDSTIGYVTSLYKDKLIKFNPSTKQIIKEIEVGSKPEGAVYSAGKIYVANSGFSYNNSVSVVDITTDIVEATLVVGDNPRFVHKGSDGNIYIVCSGKFDAVGKGGVYKINAQSNIVSDSVIINSNPGESCLILGNKMVVATNNGLLKVNLTNMTAEADVFISGLSINSLYGVIYSVVYNSKTEQLYCGNPKDFQQSGEIIIIDLNGTEIKRFEVGINPGTILILNEINKKLELHK
ncbi:MAG: YncE family protein [bacterium]